MKVLLFGMLADKIGTSVIETEQVKDVHALKNICMLSFLCLSQSISRLAVNQGKVESNALLKDEDEIALLPPFAGG